LQLDITELRYGLPGGTEKQIIQKDRMMQEQVVELVGDSKYHMKIGCRYQILFTAFNPCFALGILAFWAMTVTATVVTDAKVPAMFASVNVSSQ
jgi:hypothetical protein